MQLAKYERAVSYILIGALAGAAWLTNGEARPSLQSATASVHGRTFWDPLKVVGSEVEHFASLRSMAQKADLVVRGRITSFALSRQLRGDAAEDVVSYGVATFKVDEWVRGTAGEGKLSVEFLVPDSVVPIEEVVESQAAQLPKGNLLLFLRRKTGRGEEQFYRVVNSGGLWAEANGVVVAPLDIDAHVPSESRYRVEVQNIRNLGDLVQLVRK